MANPADLKTARLNLGFKLREVATLTGYARSTISGVENEKTKPSHRLLKQLQALYGINARQQDNA